MNKTALSPLSQVVPPAAPLFLRPSPFSIGTYLTLGLGASALGTQSVYAQVVQITSIAGVTFGAANGGLSNGASRTVTLTSTGQANLDNRAFNPANLGFHDLTSSVYNPVTYGFDLVSAVYFAKNSVGGDTANPHNFGLGQTIGSAVPGITFGYQQNGGAFKSPYGSPAPHIAPDFGPNTFLGFVDLSGRFGYLEVTWTSASNTFTILGGAFENTPGTAILAGGSAVPEPSTYAMMAGLLAGSAALYRRRQQKKDAA